MISKIKYNSIFLTIISILIGVGVLQLPVGLGNDFQERFSPEIMQHMMMVDTTARRIAHISILACIVILPIIIFIIKKNICFFYDKKESFFSNNIRYLERGVALPVLLAILFFYINTLPKTSLMNIIGDTFGMYFQPSASQYLFFVFISLFLVLIFSLLREKFIKFFSIKFFSMMTFCFVIIYLCCALLPGMMMEIPTYTLDANIFTLLSNHHGIIFGDAYKFISGQELFSEIRIMYGFIRPIFLGLIMGSTGAYDFNDNFRTIQLFQVVLCVTAAISLFLWKPRYKLAIIFSLLFFVPWFHNNHSSLLFPNHAGWRLLGFTVGFAILFFLKRYSVLKTSFILGLSGGVFFLHNPETGIALNIGYMVFLLARFSREPILIIIKASVLYIFSFFIILVCFFILVFFISGSIPSPVSWINGILFLFQSASGFAGRPYYLDIFALLVYFHMLYLAISSVLKLFNRELSFDEAFKATIAFTTMVWFAYYVNATSKQYLGSFILLYSYLIVDYLNPHILRFNNVQLNNSKGLKKILTIPYRTIIFSFILGPMIISGNMQMISSIKKTISYSSSEFAYNAKRMSGILINPTFESYISSKVNYINKQDNKNEILYISVFNQFIQSETGLATKLPMSEPYMQTFMKEDMDMILNRINELQPSRILFDVAEPEIAMVEYERKFYKRLQANLSKKYTKSSVSNNWEIWVFQGKRKLPYLDI